MRQSVDSIAGIPTLLTSSRALHQPVNRVTGCCTIPSCPDANSATERRAPLGTLDNQFIRVCDDSLPTIPAAR
jgi:hypothetical protein